MALRTTQQLQNDFPCGTTQQAAASLRKLDQLVLDGFLGDNLGEVKQIQDWIGSFTDTKGETFTPTAVVVGSAGTTLRTYSARPRYPLPFGSPGNAAPLYSGDLAANYENEGPGKPPQGRPNPLAFLSGANVQDNRTLLLGKAPTTVVDLPTTPTSLIATDYVNVTAPAIGLVPGTTFDLFVQEGLTAQAFLVATSGTVTTSDSVVVNVHTAKGVTALGPYTYTCTAAETAAQILAGVVAMLSALAVTGQPLAGWTFRASTTGNYLIVTAPTADTSGDTISLNPSASTHVLINGSNATTGNVAIAPAPLPAMIATNVAPGAVVSDNGTLVRQPYDLLGEYPHAEIWVDQTLNPTFVFTTPNTVTVNDYVTVNFVTNGGTGAYSFTYQCSAAQTAAQIVTAIQALINAVNGPGQALAGWTVAAPTATSLQFTSPDPQPDENNSQGGLTYGDSVSFDVTAAENVAVDALKTTHFTIGVTGNTTTSDSLVGTFVAQGGAITVTVTYVCTASESAAQIAAGFAAAFALKTIPNGLLQGWTCKVFGTSDLAFSAPDASGDTIILNPTSSTHVLVNTANAATSATAVGIAVDKKYAGPLLLTRFSRVNVYESAGGAPNTLFGTNSQI